MTQKFLSKCRTNHVKKVLGNACRKLGGSRATFKGYAGSVFLLCGFILRLRSFSLRPTQPTNSRTTTDPAARTHGQC
jgi:hypothetical protein